MKKFKLSKNNNSKFIYNLKLFLAPVAIIYLVAVVGIINANGGSVKIEDFIPNSFTLGGITLYVLNNALDYLRKLRG